MATHALPPAAEERSGLGVSPATLIVIFLAMAALAVGTAFYAKAYRAERLARARHYFELGERLAASGNQAAAIDQYREALAIDRNSRQYRLALALALIKLGRFDEAATRLEDVLRTDPTNGLANLMLARIAAKQGNIEQAETYYNRAIYGYWPHGGEQNRIEARFELINLLGEAHASRGVIVAQLLELLDAVPNDIAARMRVAGLLLTYGADNQAADVFRELLKAQPRNAAAHAGYGEAEFQLGNYSAARNALRQAVRLNPANQAARNRLETVDAIVALDPTLRGLSFAERYRRSIALLKSAADDLQACTSSQKTPQPDVEKLLSQAQSVLTSSRPPRRYSEALDNNLSLAQQLWETRTKLCGPIQGSEQVLARIFTELSR